MRVLSTEETAFVAGGDGGCGAGGDCGDGGSEGGMCGETGMDMGNMCMGNLSVTDSITGQTVSLNIGSIFSSQDSFGFSIAVNGVMATLVAGLDSNGNVVVSVLDASGNVIGGATIAPVADAYGP